MIYIISTFVALRITSVNEINNQMEHCMRHLRRATVGLEPAERKRNE